MEPLSALLVQAIALVISSMVTAALVALRAYLKAKLNSEQYELLDRLASGAVWAIEQTGTGPFSTKKEAATSIVTNHLAARGIQLPDSTVSAAIESNVATSFNYSKLAHDTGEGA